MTLPAPDFANTPVAPRRPHFDYLPREHGAPPAVTVVTPFYNTDEVFLETAQCVASQSLQQWEWLIINDGSDRPESLQILDTYRERDRRIRVIDMGKNRGLPAARNVGLREARAHSVFFLDSDDLLEPTALEKTAWCLESYPEFSFCKGLTVAFGGQVGFFGAGFETGRLFLSRNIVTIRSLVRREMALSVGGFDESFVHGLEDWEFWLHCASHGFWGYSIPEVLDWYRRRETHSDRWSAWTPSGIAGMRKELRRRYPRLYAGKFPPTTAPPLPPYPRVRDEIPFANLLTKNKRRILLVIPWMALGGSDKFNLDLIGQLQGRDYEVTITTTLPDNYPWHAEFARLTPDVFILPSFLRPNDYPRFLCYLVHSRQCDAVLVSNSELGYRFLPYLRARCPETAFLDFCHMEEEHWNNGGHPRQGVAYQDVLDLNVVSSQHLKAWMIERGADASQIEVCYTNVDSRLLKPEPGVKARVRTELGIPVETPVLLYAGRLCRQKQPQIFLRVMQELRARRLEFACLVAGDGDQRRWLASELRRHRLARSVTMLGAVTTQKMHELLAASDILFLPSQMEGIALAIFEAMAMEVVPVSADVGGQSELVTPDCGVLIRPGTEDCQVTSYADALERLLRDAELRTGLGRNARIRACSGFHIEQMGARMVELLEKAQRYHLTRPKPEAGPRLAAELAVLAVEHARVSEATGPLWKYHRLEAIRRQFIGSIVPTTKASRKLLSSLASPLRFFRAAKDTIWIVGHRIKMYVRRT